ncbi:MAG TPA: TlpA disulfide reductase family protein [Isosphaeraceae bacterium]|nr:TlpA disulfide reductase family protein [Isosphaeraceae bacterium]
MKILLIGLLVVVTTGGPTEDSPRAQYEAIVKEFDTAYKAAMDAVTKASNDQERIDASSRRPQPHEFAARLFALAEQHPEDAAALDALTWVASKCIFGPHAEKALGMIARLHGRSERLKDFCGQCSRYGEPFPPYEEMLRVVLKNNPHREVQAAACLSLAEYLKMAKEKTESRLVKLTLDGGMPLSSDQMKNVQRMKERGLDAVAAESAALFQKVIDEYGDIRFENNYPPKAADYARGQLYLLRNLGIGLRAPEIVGKDIYGKAMKLSDYRGKVVVLDFGSHRSCGVCRQFYPYLRTMVETFKEKPFALLGISVDDDVKDLVTLAEKGENTWPIWWDGKDLEGPLASQWVITSMPTFFVLDQNGVIRNQGFIQPDEIAATVNMLLREMGEAKKAKAAG